MIGPYAGLLVRDTGEFISLVVCTTVSYTTTGLSDGLFDTSCLFQYILVNTSVSTSVSIDDTIAVSIEVTVTLTAIGLVQSMKSIADVLIACN